MYRMMFAVCVMVSWLGMFAFAQYVMATTSDFIGQSVFYAMFIFVTLLAWSIGDTSLQRQERRLRAKLLFRNFVGELETLTTALRKFSYHDHDPLSEIVEFFNVVSVWHDKDLTGLLTAIREANTGGRYDDIFNHLISLQLHFRNAGRDQCGWNRTQKGERVTADKVFLGNIFGLFTHPVSYWVTCKNEPKGAWKNGMWDGHRAVENRNAYDVVSDQARRFMESHVGPMLQIIESLERVTI